MVKKAKSQPAERVETWPLSKIIPYERNARTHGDEQIALLSTLMLKHGVDQPIVVDENGVILKGHGRRLAAIKAGFDSFPVVVHRGLSEDDKKALRIADNQIALLAGWNAELIRLEVGELSLSGYELPLLGFSTTELANFLDTTTGETDPDEVPELPKTAVSRLGDLWVLGRHRLLCGSATEEADVNRLLGNRKPQLCVTDPPYGVDYNPNWRVDERDSKGRRSLPQNTKRRHAVMNDKQADWQQAWELCPSDVIYAWTSSLYMIESGTGLREAGFVLRASIIWDKGSPVIGRGDYHWRHEPCWYAVRKGKTAHWNGDRKQTTVWLIPKQMSNETGHGTQKPIECMQRPIINNSAAGDWVYDCFVGSGTTVIACETTGRKCVAMELDPIYCDVIVERWQNFTGEKAKLDGKTMDEVRRARGGKKKPPPSEAAAVVAV